MRILLLSQWCYPEPGPRVHELAGGLAKRGHQVLLVTGFPTYPKSHFYEGYRPSLYRRDAYGKADILRLPIFPHGEKSVIKRILNYGSFMVSMILIAPWLIGRADCMYVFLPPPTTGLAAWILSVFKRTPFVCDVQDIWPESVVASGMLSDGKIVNLIASVQRFIYNRSKLISVPSPGYKKNLTSKGVAEEKIEVVPNWADTSIFRPVPYDEKLAKELDLKGKFNVLFAGNFGIVQALDTVIGAAEQLREISDIRFLFAGSGVEETRLRNLCELKGLDNVRFLGRFPQDQMASVCAASDVLLVHLKRDPLFEITIPSKTLAYLACGKPVLMAVAGDAADLIETQGAGLTCPPEDPAAMAAAVRQLYETSPEQRAAMGKAGRAYFLDHCTLDIVVETYERLFEDIRRR